MKLHFEPGLEYQLRAIDSVVGLFRGQEVGRSEFTVTAEADRGQLALQYAAKALGVGNRLTLLDDEILANLREIQLRNGLPPSEKVVSGDFTVEMETGTGKTYVYLRTAFELNRHYGFTKFIIVVPSVAIREGVNQALRAMAGHFRTLYAGVPFESFVYDSSEPGQIRNFATSPHLQFMVVTVQSLVRKDYAVVYKSSEGLGGERPIDLIRETRPVLIVDEPQSVDGGLEGKGRQALGEMKPLCTLRYSATHADKHHMVYRLDAVDAYEQRLVKQIEVAAATVEAGFNKPFVRLVGVLSRKGKPVTAKVELDMQTEGGSVRRQELSVVDGDMLDQVTGREVYRNCRIGEIRAGKGSELLEIRVPGGEHFLRVGEAYGDVEGLAIQREMIRRTIKEHFDKEHRLAPSGIKVLSLFFIDAVERYRQYDADGNAIPGAYAQIFEEEYARAARHPDNRSLFPEVDVTSLAREVHGGYFSIDRRKVGSKTVEEFRDTRGNTAADDDTYSLIMRDKERLLSFDSKLKFIFSHSALREGWDNPNVFQICVLREIGSERERRQTIGRGLRLCVNQAGERVRGFQANTLTVIAKETYQEFADNLQNEIEEDTGFRFGVVLEHQFAAVSVSQGDGSSQPLGFERSKELWHVLREAGYLDARGRVKDALRTALRTGSVVIPEPFTPQAGQIKEILKKLAGRLEVQDADKREKVRTRRAVLHGEDFKALWERIRTRTTYRVQFDNARLVDECTRALREAPPVTRARLHWRKADLEIGKSGIEAHQKAGDAVISLNEGDIELPDLLTELQDRTQLTRRSIHRMVTESGRLRDFLMNPQEFIRNAAEAINRAKRLALVDGIRYQRLGSEAYYAQELFEQEELSGYLRSMIAANKSVHEYVIYQSDTERSFAEQLERNEAIKVYAKLPGWFRVPTPLGSYNPDWAVLVQRDDGERLYLVVETKSSLFADDLRDVERGKIRCGQAHFREVAGEENPARFLTASKVEEVLDGP